MERETTSPIPQSETVKISLPWTWRPVKRRMMPGCELFREGDTAMHVARKLIPLESDKDDDKDDDNVSARTKTSEDSNVKENIPCSVIGCPQIFTSLLSYENHYKSTHCHVCLTCHRTLPSEFLLNLHIEENHDPLFAVLSSKQHVYRCVVESCGAKFGDPDARRQHMVTVHSYPANFRFHSLRPSPHPQHSKKKAAQPKPTVSEMDVNRPLPPNARKDGHKGDTRVASTLVTPHPLTCPSKSSQGDEENSVAGGGEGGRGGEGGMEVGEAEKPAPRRVFVHKVPQHFAFGHGVSRGFHRPPGKKNKGRKKGEHWHQRTADEGSGETATTNMENVDMKDMADALSETV